MGPITQQHFRVFAMFSAAMVITGLAYAFASRGDVGVALTAASAVVAFVSAIILEAQNS